MNRDRGQPRKHPRTHEGWQSARPKGRLRAGPDRRSGARAGDCAGRGALRHQGAHPLRRTRCPAQCRARRQAEAAQHKDWDPNAQAAGQAGTPPPKPATSAGGVAAAPPAAAPVAARRPRRPRSRRRLPLRRQLPAATASAPKAVDGPPMYLLRAGRRLHAGLNDAEAAACSPRHAGLQRQGLRARASGDRTVFRVRMGPFDERAAADALQAQVQAATGMEAAVVRTQR